MNIIEVHLGFKGAFSFVNDPDTIILHHAGASNCTVFDIHNWHLARGWVGIGYHYFVNKKGEVYRGRPENAIGAHCGARNTDTIGICAEGNYMTDTMPEVQKNAIKELIADIKSRRPKVKTIKGHKEFMATDCPGTNYPLDEMKSVTVQEKKVVPYCGYLLSIKLVGHKDNNVMAVQRMLKITNDGYFGNNTKNAVMKFQKEHGLSVDGIVGQNTWNALFN